MKARLYLLSGERVFETENLRPIAEKLGSQVYPVNTLYENRLFEKTGKVEDGYMTYQQVQDLT